MQHAPPDPAVPDLHERKKQRHCTLEAGGALQARSSLPLVRQHISNLKAWERRLRQAAPNPRHPPLSLLPDICQPRSSNHLIQYYFSFFQSVNVSEPTIIFFFLPRVFLFYKSEELCSWIS